MAISRIAADREQRQWQTVALPLAGWIVAAAVLVVLALANPTNGDEDLFVAPAALPASARLYVDFLFLHMPLQAELTRIFAPLFPGYAFIALRVAMAVMGLALLGLVYAAQRGIGVERRPALICTALLACTYSFQFSSGVVRNDIMAALFSTAGIAAALVALRAKPHAAPAWAAAGLLFSAAAAVRISAAFPAAGAGLFLINEVVRRRISPAGLAAFTLGAGIGLVPCLLAFLAAPQAFIFSVLTYHSVGNLYWFVTTGRQAVLSPAANVVITVGVLAVGPGLGALLAVARAFVRREPAERQTSSYALFLDVVVFAGLIAALLPTPSNFQEAMAFLPQLFIRLGLEMPRLLASKHSIERFTVRLIAFGAVVGCGYGLFVVAPRPGKARWPAIEVTEQAHRIGDRLRAAGADGFVSTFAAHLMLDSGYPLDPRFSSGVFLYRSAALVPVSQLDRLHGIGPQNLTQALDKNPPAAILARGSLMDRDLGAYAQSHHYQHETDPAGDLYIRRP
jgi:hypothetical protein